MKNLKMAVIFSLLFNSLLTFAQTTVLPDQPGYYRMQLGNAQVFTLLDGTYSLNVKEHLHGITKNLITDIMHNNYLDTNYEITFSAFLVHTKDQLILIDAGSGNFMGSGLGKVLKNLRAVGFEPKDITAILITHGHADHLGGLVNNNEPVFPNATVYLSKAESDYWLTTNNKQKASKENKPFFEIAENALAPYIKAGKLKTFAPGAELLKGVSTVDVHGHTPGSTAYLLESGGQHMLFVGDMVHISAIQFSHPAVTIDYDVDQQVAAATRQKEFKELAQSGYWVAAPHMPFPGIGHIKAVGNVYQWVPTNFSVNFTNN